MSVKWAAVIYEIPELRPRRPPAVDPNADRCVTISSFAAFVPSPLTDFVVLAWRRDHAAFDDNAWLIPASDIPHLTRTDWRTSHIELRIGITRGSRFDKYRKPRDAIATAIEDRMLR